MITGIYNLAVDPNWKNVQLQEVFLECDTTVAPVTINLFEIAKLNRFWNVSLIVSDSNNNAGTNAITINTGGSDTFDNDTSSQITISTNGASVVLQVVSEAQWLAKESIGGGSGITSLKLAKLPNSSMVINSEPQPNLYGKVYDLGLVLATSNVPLIELDNGSLATVEYCQSVLKDGTYIYEAYDTQTLDPISGYWVAFRANPLNPSELVKVAELKMTQQYWYNWHDYTLKDGADNEVKYVQYAFPNSDSVNIQGWITTLSYSNGVLTAVDSNPTFGGATVLSLYNSLTGLGILSGNWQYCIPEYILDDDYWGMGVGSDYGWMYYKDRNQTGANSWKFVGFNVLTGQTRYVDALAEGIANITNFDWASFETTPENAFGFAYSHPSGLLLTMADNNILNNGQNFYGVSAYWSPYWADNTNCLYANVRNPQDGSYIYTKNDFSTTYYPSNNYWDSNNFYIVIGNLYYAQSAIMVRINIATKETTYWKIPNTEQDLYYAFYNGYANNESLFFPIYAPRTLFGTFIYCILSNKEPIVLQSNNGYPTNMLGSKSYSTNSGLFRNTFALGIEVDEWNGVQF